MLYILGPLTLFALIFKQGPCISIVHWNLQMMYPALHRRLVLRRPERLSSTIPSSDKEDEVQRGEVHLAWEKGRAEEEELPPASCPGE